MGVKPGSKGRNWHGLILAKLMLPDRICDVLLSGVESVDLATEEAHEVQTSLARQHAVHLGMVVDADISDQLNYAIECETHLSPDMGGDIQKLVDLERCESIIPIW